MQKSFLLGLFVLILFGCNDENSGANDSQSKKNKNDFNSISTIWNFNIPNSSPLVSQNIANWNHWQQFLIELKQKPKSNLTAFQLKTKNLSSKIDSLTIKIPVVYDKPEVKSRISTLSTKVKMLSTFLNLEEIPMDRVKKLIPEINEEVIGLVNQWEEIEIKKQIPKEIGEDEMIKALDTTRNANSKLMQEKMDAAEKSDATQNQENPVKIVTKTSRVQRKKRTIN